MAPSSETADPTASRRSRAASRTRILCVTAVKILTDSSTGSGTPKEATAGVLGWSGGTVLVAIAGAVLIGVAAYQAYKGLAKKFLDDAKTSEMSPGVHKGYTALGVFGHVARAVIFTLVGYGLIKAAIDYDPREAIGLDGALRNSRMRRMDPRCWASSPPGWPGSRSTQSPTPATARCDALFGGRLPAERKGGPGVPSRRAPPSFTAPRWWGRGSGRPAAWRRTAGRRGPGEAVSP